MDMSNSALGKTDDLPILHEGSIHSGKVRSVYWLPRDNSRRLIEEQNYDAHPDTQLGVMITSDRISAFDAVWQGENGLAGVPGKGAALNQISEHWFANFEAHGLPSNHLLDAPHPLAWIVQRAEPVLVEGIVRGYITGSMWRAYKKGDREFCGHPLPDGLQEFDRLETPLFTPTTKGVMRGLEGVPEKEDAKVTLPTIIQHAKEFGLKKTNHIHEFQHAAMGGYERVGSEVDLLGYVEPDTKFEMGYLRTLDGNWALCYIDEVGTPDSSRFWPTESLRAKKPIDSSKEGFRSHLRATLEEDILLNDDRMDERQALAAEHRVPVEAFMEVSKIYGEMAQSISKKPLPTITNAREEILDALQSYNIVT